MTKSKLDRSVIFILRILMGWTFLYAALAKYGRISTPPVS